MWSVCQSLNAPTQSQNDRDSPKIISDTLIKRNSINKRRLNTVTLLFLLPFNVFARMDNRSAIKHRLLTDGSLRLRVGVGVGPILPTPAPTPTPTKTVDSGRLQLRSRLRLRSPDPNSLFQGNMHCTEPKPAAKQSIFCHLLHGGVFLVLVP